jgi:hypothetical protein
MFYYRDQVGFPIGCTLQEERSDFATIVSVAESTSLITHPICGKRMHYYRNVFFVLFCLHDLFACFVCMFCLHVLFA